MVYLIILGAALVILFIRSIIVNKNKLEATKKELQNGFGKIRKKDYSFQGKNHRKALIKRNIDTDLLDDITWHDLDMESVYERIDSCKSAIGEEYLYELLHNVKPSFDSKNKLDELVDYFNDNPSERGEVLLKLCRLGYLGKYSPFDYLDFLTSKKLGIPIKDILLVFLYLIPLGLVFYNPLWGGIGFILIIVVNVFVYFNEKKELEGLMESLSFIVRLSKESLLVNGEDNASKYGFFFDDEQINLLKSINRSGSYLYASGRNNTGATVSSSPIDMLLVYINMLFHIDMIQYRIMLNKLCGQKEFITKVLMLFGRLDTAISIASFRKSLGDKWCKHEVTDASSLHVEDAYHLLIKDPVPNSISTTKGVLLTGSNASGKSTFLRTMAICNVLAQTINTAPAKKYVAPVLNVYSSIALKDNLAGGDSYFMVEIKALKRIFDAKQKNEPLICYVDEVLRGTNTVERISASTVLLKALAGDRSICFAATHDLELTDNLSHEFDNYHFTEKLDEGDIYFDYKLLEGPATSRNALALLSQIGFPGDLIEEARNLSFSLYS